MVALALTHARGRAPTPTECQQSLQDLHAAGTRSGWLLQLWHQTSPAMPLSHWLSRRQRWALGLARWLRPLGARWSRLPVQRAERAIVLHALTTLPIDGLRSWLQHRSALQALSELPTPSLQQLLTLQPALTSLSELPIDSLRQWVQLQPALHALSELPLAALHALAQDQQDRLSAQPEQEALSQALARFYLDFENACRAPSEQLMTHFQLYDPWIERLPRQADAPVLDIGCGRGEWLLYLRSKGIEGLGIDINGEMVQHSRSQGLPVHQVDALEWLSSCPASSLSGISAFQVAEHLDFTALFQLVRHAHRTLVPGGQLLLETPNPENLLVGSHTFYHDPTHRHPLTPTLLTFLLKHHGFTGLEVVRSNPYPHDAKVPGDDALTARVNGHLCGPQDFALLAQKT